jgi:phosphoserine aminotransferase
MPEEWTYRTRLNAPPTHTIFFTQGGRSAQFSAAMLNLLAPSRAPQYTHDGLRPHWLMERRAFDEAKRLGGARATVAVDARKYWKDNAPLQPA